MTDKKRIIEYIKSALIVLLLISAALLIYHTGYYSSAFEKMESIIRDNGEHVLESGSAETGDDNHVSARAKELSVSFSSGSRYASAYDSESVDEDHSRFSAFLGEALGSASAPQAVNKEKWIDALEGESVYIHYYTDQFLSTLSGRLGTVLSASAVDSMASEFCLLCGDTTAQLFYRSGEEYFVCETAVSASALKSRIDEYIPNNALFSHEDALLSGLRNSALVLKSISSVPEVAGEGGVQHSQLIEPLMTALGLNEYTSSQYSEADGTTVYVDSNSVLRVSPSGHVQFELNGEATRNTTAGSISAALDLAWELAGATIGANSGAADIYLSDFGYNEDGSFGIYFDYVINGIPLSLGSRNAAYFEINKTELVYAEMYCRSYSFSGEVQNILPMYQAAAIASADGKSGLSLVYSDKQETIDCIWVNE